MSTDVFHQLGHITRQLHDTLTQLGVVPQLQQAALDLPDARSRLGYIAHKSAAAADRVLTSVDRAKAEHARIADANRRIACALAADVSPAIAHSTVLGLVVEVEAATARVDAHLTDIMLAQDFHDLTGQVVAKVVALAGELEHGLVKLLLQAAPQDLTHKREAGGLGGPVIDATGRADVVASQGEVDELLASLGF